ncbi:MAG: hypothetical protein ACC651_16155 [Candidatus Scalindua sp.]
MKYKVTASLLKDKMPAFYEVLTNGTVQNQKPDGTEIVSAMRRAKFTSPDSIEWYETCYCPSPLQHERETVYDQYLANIETQLVETLEEIEGEPFWLYLERASEGSK